MVIAMWADDDADPFEEPLTYWPDPYTRMIAEAPPKSRLFEEFVALAMRARIEGVDDFFVAADVASVMAEEQVHFTDLATALRVPYPFIYAVKRGWHRLSLTGLALVAEALNVPISAFIVDANGHPRLDVRRYHAYRIATRPGGGRQL
jgi:hypothetical protein